MPLGRGPQGPAPALQTALLNASSEENFRRTLVFHHVVKEAEAFAADLPDIAAQLHASDPVLYPKTIWADWLCGDHKPLQRRRLLGEFAAGIATDGTVVEKCFLCSVKVLGEGVRAPAVDVLAPVSYASARSGQVGED
ncbi:hypothetical protein [[Kitasatospora] papulosa]|uniref:hypothetical protein n=1 Tax=[Kitasatospora] papulosa TaxID=1464011 RepID=UPI0036827598